MSRRALLEHNSGEWHGLFIRLDHTGVEQTRFNTVLRVQEEAELVVAALTDCSTGQTRTMRFGDLPAAMQVDGIQIDWACGKMNTENVGFNLKNHLDLGYPPSLPSTGTSWT